MALELALENQLLSHTEVFVDVLKDQQRAVLDVGMGVGWVWLSVNWLGDSRSRNRKTGRPQKLEGRSVRSQKSQVSNENSECGASELVVAAGKTQLAYSPAGCSWREASVFKFSNLELEDIGLAIIIKNVLFSDLLPALNFISFSS